MKSYQNQSLYIDVAISLCSRCLIKVEAKIFIEDNSVYMHKRCPSHGDEKVLIATDVEYYKRSRNYTKASTLPLRFNTPYRYGCPYDCGICPEHEQHSCVSVVELTDLCQLKCPTCYAESGPRAGSHRSLSQINKMLDAVVANEGEADVVQLSGGEPTLHPDFFAILELAKSKPIKHIMLNTNGILISQDENFVARLAEFKTGFEVYLQFDSLKENPLLTLRGRNLLRVRHDALENLNKYGVSTTLVVTVRKGLNSDELGEIIEFSLKQPCVRGVTFQPIQAAGRLEGFDPSKHRLTLTEVRQNILQQTSLFKKEDIIPVPCHPEAIAMAYALKNKNSVTPLSDLVDPEELLSHSENRITVEKDPRLREAFWKLFSTSTSPSGVPGSLKSLLCCLPKLSVSGLSYDNVFRVIIMQFIDAYNFDLRSIRKSCVHIVHDDGRLIPFDTMNLFYRKEKELYLKKIQNMERKKKKLLANL